MGRSSRAQLMLLALWWQVCISWPFNSQGLLCCLCLSSRSSCPRSSHSKRWTVLLIDLWHVAWWSAIWASWRCGGDREERTLPRDPTTQWDRHAIGEGSMLRWSCAEALTPWKALLWASGLWKLTLPPFENCAQPCELLETKAGEWYRNKDEVGGLRLPQGSLKVLLVGCRSPSRILGVSP